MVVTTNLPASTDQRDLEEILQRLIGSEPERIWSGTELVLQLGQPPMPVFVALARLTGEGRLEHVGPGRYRAPIATAARLIRQLDREVFGETSPRPRS